MREIILTQGKVALVDDKDFEYLNQWKWYAAKSYRTYYAERKSSRSLGKRKQIKMHRVIMNPPKGMETDHQDHNGLNCQRYNMRNCTHSQNQMNQTPHGKSKYLGVSYKNNKSIRAVINVNKKHIHLGIFKTEIEAAIAYDKAAKMYFDEFANPNFK